VFDVVVDMTALGLAGTWVIECKDWSSRVEKGIVRAFIEDVQNAGADKGVMVSRSGYQSGCAAAVKNRNVLLLTPLEFEDSVGTQIAWERLRQARPRLDALVDHLERMHVYGSCIPGKPFRYGMEEHFPSGPESDHYSKRLTALRVLLEAVTGVLAGDTHFRLPDLRHQEDPDEDPPDDWYPTVKVDDIRVFAKSVTSYLVDWEVWAKNLIAPP
jgi:hypothetical protein